MRPQTAVIYTRVSTERQVTNASLETQEKSCLIFCEQNGWEVLRIFREEGESAKTANRPKLIAALDYCCTLDPSPDYFVVYAVDRLARRIEDHLFIRARLKAKGTKLRSATQTLGEDSTQKYLETIIAAAAEFDNSLRAEKTVAGMKTRASEGQRVWKAPIGYRNALNGARQKTMVPDPERAPLVSMAFEMFSDGLHSKSEVLRKVTDLGLRSKTGRKLTLEDFKRMLANPSYKGIISVERWGIETKGNFPPLVSEEVFNRVQLILRAKRKATGERQLNHPDFPLRNFLKCGSCGKPLTASFSTGRSKRKYAYYHCQNRNCSAPANEPRSIIEDGFRLFLEKLRCKRELVDLFRRIVSDVWEEKKRLDAEEGAIYRRQLAELEHRKTKLFDAYSGGVLRIDEYKSMKEVIEQEIAIAQIRECNSSGEDADPSELLTFAESIFSDPANFWQTCPPDQKVRLQRFLFPEGVNYKDGYYRTDSTCLLFKLLQENEAREENLVALTGIEPVFRP